ncbi:monocarboxylate transporter 12-like [Haliotis rubra]|uniref:monocarboxylate transporter 12-like n=1 Tax=Haliotis rubra TaxID=36100 RepID=UPI001EE607C6|nr:monocarboxylate transporter 12-like [Haliotis rubra]
MLINLGHTAGVFTTRMNEEGMYSWVVLGASFTTLLIGPSITYATGVFLVAMLKEFEEDLVLTTWVGSTFGCMFALAGPVASVIINMFDCRTCVVMSGVLMMTGFATSFLVTDIRFLFLTFSLVAGLGMSLAGTGAIVVLGYYFHENAAIASSICFTGAGIGIFVHPALVQFLLETYGFHGAYLIMGGITFHACAAGMLMRPPVAERTRKQHVLGGQTLRNKILLSMCGTSTMIFSVIQNVSFLLFVGGILCFALAVSTQYQFLPEFFITQGSTLEEASFVVSASGVGSIFSRFLVGFAASDERIGGATIFSSINGIMAVFAFLLPLFKSSTYPRIAYGIILGLYTGGTWVLMATLTLDILDLQNFATGVGIGRFLCGAGFLVGPPIAGTMMEQSGDNNSAFLFSGAMFFGNCVWVSVNSEEESPEPSDTLQDTRACRYC